MNNKSEFQKEMELLYPELTEDLLRLQESKSPLIKNSMTGLAKCIFAKDHVVDTVGAPLAFGTAGAFAGAWIGALVATATGNPTIIPIFIAGGGLGLGGKAAEEMISHHCMK